MITGEFETQPSREEAEKIEQGRRLVNEVGVFATKKGGM